MEGSIERPAHRLTAARSRAPRAARVRAAAAALPARQWLVAGASGGLLAGAGVAWCEVAALVLRTRVDDGGLLVYATLLYGLLGAVTGGGLGAIAWAIDRTTRRDWHDPVAAHAGLLAANAALLAVVIVRFQILRDVFLERLRPAEPRSLILHAAIALGAIATAWVGARLLLLGVRLHPPLALLARPLGATVLFAWIVVGAAAVGRATTAAGAPGPSATPIAVGAARASTNVLLVVVDTLRADHLSCYAETAPPTPALDALAADGIRYANAVAQASWTKPSFATLLTSTYPSAHGAEHKRSVLPRRVDTLAEVLAAHGYRTAGFPNNKNVTATYGFAQGFTRYRFLAPDYRFAASEASAHLAYYQLVRLLADRLFASRVAPARHYREAEQVTDAAIAWMRTHDDAPFFLLLHYMDPHAPYFRHPFDGSALVRAVDPQPAPELAGAYREAYRGEVRYLDRGIGRLLDWMRARGLYDRTVVVLTGDHGEELYEHGGWWHGSTLYAEQIRIPLLVKPAHGRAHGRVERRPARHLDVAPTVVELAGVAAPASWRGRSLLDAATAPDPVTEPVFSEEAFEGNVVRAVQQGRYKLIVAAPNGPRGLPPLELYDVEADPGEQRELSGGGAAAETVARLRRTMEEMEMEARAGGDRRERGRGGRP